MKELTLCVYCDKKLKSKEGKRVNADTLAVACNKCYKKYVKSKS